jgi:DnaJ family protein C protein 13
MFEKVNKAYEFLCTKSTKIIDGPDPENIILILKTQSILFNRHKEGEVCYSDCNLSSSLS